MSRPSLTRAPRVAAFALLIAACGPSREQLGRVRFFSGEAVRAYNSGRFSEALISARRAVELAEAELGGSHPDLAIALNNLAAIHQATGAWADAEVALRRALAIQTETYGGDDARVATTSSNLAGVYTNTGAWAEAVPLLEQSLAVFARQRGGAHVDTAVARGNLGVALMYVGRLERADVLLAEAITELAALRGREHPDVATALDNHATALRLADHDERALPEAQEALEIRLATLGPRHPAVATSLHNLALIYSRLGRYDRAEHALTNALELYEAVYGPWHPQAAIAYENLASLAAGAGDLDRAAERLRRSAEINERLFRQMRLVATEERVSALLRAQRLRESAVYGLVREHPSHRGLLRVALATALLHKGRAVDEAASTALAVRRGLDSDDRARFDDLRALRSRLAAEALSARGADPATVRALEEECQRIERDLAQRSARLRAQWELPAHGEVIERVAAELPRDGALVEYVCFTPRGAAAEGERLVAFVLTPSGEVSASDLGPVAVIDRSVRELSSAVTNPAGDPGSAARGLHRLVLEPLAARLAGRRELLISPDGSLNLVPFALLDDGRGAAVDRWNLTLLTSGRDLLRRPGESRSSSVALLADPDFGGDRATAPGGLRAVVSGRLSPIPATRQEARAIGALFADATLILGADATERALLSLEAPGILHVATHGVFLGDEGGDAGSSRAIEYVREPPPDEGPTLRVTVDRSTSPLARSALILAGVAGARADGSSDDGLATALEVSGMDLWGTQLVVLSACDTGRGEARVGEGVYGLRRAVMVAGAETLVTSLWRVDDEATRDFMVAFYRQLLAGVGRSQSLRAAAAEVRRRRPHPFYWAPFVLVGNRGPIVGFRAAGQVTS